MVEPDTYRPRPHDELVEPVFGGLRGASESTAGTPSVDDVPPADRTLLARLTALLTRPRRKA